VLSRRARPGVITGDLVHGTGIAAAGRRRGDDRALRQ
jgi:hypothetical protein